MNFEEYRQHDATSLAELVRKKEVTPHELLNLATDRCEAVNTEINAVVQKNYAKAQEYCDDIDLTAPFAGVPFLLKDMANFQKGIPATFGSRLCENFVPQADSGLVQRFKKTGVNIFGRTNSCEFGLKYMTEPELHGPTRNPWALHCTPGGSSGGAAAAVASGIIPMAQASDGGGSIRVPAACNGLFGFKPARGRVSVGPEVGEIWNGLAVQFVLSRSVRDTALMLDLMKGYITGDPYFPPPGPDSFVSSLKAPPKKLKIRVTHNTYLENVKPTKDAIKAVEHAAALCEDLGHEIIWEDPAFDRAGIETPIVPILCANLKSAVDMLAARQGIQNPRDYLEQTTQFIYDAAEKFSAVDFCGALQVMHNESRKIVAEFDHFDVLLTPTIASSPLQIGELKRQENDLESFWAGQTSFGPYTSLFNFTGQPAMSVPLYWTDQNMPLGVQFVGSPFGSEILFQLARQLEEAQPWFMRFPIDDDGGGL